MTRPVSLAAALAVIVLAAAGCGGEDPAATPAGAVRAYNDAVAAGDGERACELLDPAAQEELRQSTQGTARGSCRQVIDLLAAFYDDATKERLRNAQVAASEQGDRASARFRSPEGFGGPDQAQTYELRRRGDEWRITSLGLTAVDPGAAVP